MPALPDESRQIGIIRASIVRDFEPWLDNGSFTHPDPAQRAANLASRSLAGLIARDRMNCDAERAATMVTDGGQDFGIDAIAISDVSPRVWLIQSKWSDKGAARFGEADVMTMADGLVRIDQRSFDRFNAKLRAHTAQLAAIWLSPQLKVTLVLALMRRDPVHDNVRNRLDELRDSFNRHGTYLDYEILYLPEIWELVRRGADPVPIDLSLTLDRWFDVSTPMRAANGIVGVTEVAEWHAHHGDQLFRKNIRESLGVTPVNADIERTLVDDPHSFWYRNNGITMLCDSLKITPVSRSAPHGVARVDVRNASIINGAQTVASIASAMRADSEAAGQATVGIRIIESGESDTSNEITKSTNTQNHIERRDFVALDRVQIEIREDFRLTLGLTYAIRRSEFEPSPESGCTVREAAVALACAHPNADLATRIRQNEDLLWEEGAAGAYNLLFGERPTAVQIWRSVLLLREVRDSLHEITARLEGRAAAIAEQSTLIVAHIIFRQLGREGVEDPDVDWRPVLDQVPGLTNRAIQWMIYEVDKNYGKNSFIAGTFSSADRVRSLVAEVIQLIESDARVPELPVEYVPVPRQRTARRANSVPLIVDAGRIKDSTQLVFEAQTGPERLALEKWLAEDSRRGIATWVNNRSKPLVWSFDGKRYSPTGLVKKMYALAEWAGAPVAVQGPARWFIRDEGNLVWIAEAIAAESASTDLDEGAAS
ncbi:AIPR family protein [Micromonospora sp. CPCC 205711]|uniref:AIPR family protein n=1 Tax=Micromonospora sp. CPCC 205547 TaxID=3122400 RepID=UPI002FF1FCD3